MADLSLDEIIASKKGMNFKVQFTNQPKSGKPNQGGPQRRPGFRPGFKNRQGQQGSANRPGLQTKGYRERNSVQNNGRGQIDARDMITIKNRNKMPDARVKIAQKRIGQKTFDARSKLQPKRLPQNVGPRGGSVQTGSQQLLAFPRQVSPSPGLQKLPAQNRGNLADFTIAFNPIVPSSKPVGLLTRTLQNPSASRGGVVENTGSSLKITRPIPDITFDGQHLTVTRRLPQGSNTQGSTSNSKRSSSSSFNASQSRVAIDRGPVIQIQNDKFQPTPIQAPTPSNPVRTRQAPSQGQKRIRPPSPVEPPVPKRAPNKTPRVEEVIMKTTPSTGYTSNSRYKTLKNKPVLSTTLKTEDLDTLYSDRLMPVPSTTTSSLQTKRSTQQSGPSVPRQTQSAPAASKPAKSALPASKRLAPHPSQSQSGGEQRASKTSSKKRAPMSLSERFASRESGSSSPVIIDYVPPIKKRRVPQPEPVKEEFAVEDFEVKEVSEEEDEEEVVEEEPAVTLLSPLQGFRILVTNLHASVTQDDIIELFGAIGPLKRAKLLSKGQAEVAFIHREHAVVALKKYHNRELDGQPMFVKMTTPLNAKVLKPTDSEDNTPGLPPSLRTSSKKAAAAAAAASTTAPVEIPLIHKALFKTGGDSAPSKSVRFTVKL